jgi:hypothetical protein
MSPNDRFFEVTVQISTEDNKGRIKHETCKYLIDAADTAQAEKNTFKLMEGTLDDWEIIGINLSKIKEIYMENL